MNDKERDIYLSRMYRSVFNNPSGRIVLADILVGLKFFDTVEAPEDIALSNFARLLLARIGVWSAENVDIIVATFLEIQTKIGGNADG